MKIKPLNRQTAKWWNREKSLTWAYKKGEDWWLIRPEKQNEPKSNKKTKISGNKEIDYFKLFLVCAIGPVAAFLLFSAIYLSLNIS